MALGVERYQKPARKLFSVISRNPVGISRDEADRR